MDAVEGDSAASRSLKRNLKKLSQAQSANDSVQTWLRKSGVKKCDGVVLDPPRVGAGKDVVKAIAALEPKRVVYVACDPAALARDIAEFGTYGYAPTDISAWDAFPMTGHFETIVRFN